MKKSIFILPIIGIILVVSHPGQSLMRKEDDQTTERTSSPPANPSREIASRDGDLSNYLLSQDFSSCPLYISVSVPVQPSNNSRLTPIRRMMVTWREEAYIPNSSSNAGINRSLFVRAEDL